MAELRWIQMFLLMILMLRFSVTLRFSYITFRDGDDVALSCQNEINDHDKCSLTHWIFRDSQEAAEIDLVKSGQIDQTHLSTSRSDRLNVTEKCSLVIKNVTYEDVGRYVCRQQDRDSDFDLSVVTLTEENTDQGVILKCFVEGTGKCKHTVKWLFMSKEMERDHPDFQPSQSSCFATVSIRQFHYIYPSRFTAFQCEVTGPHRKKQFSFRQSGGDTKITTSPTTTSPTTTKKYDPENLKDWQRGLIAVTGIIAAVIITVLLVKLRKHGKKTQRNENMNHRTSGGVTDQSQADPQDGLSYASVSFTQSSDKAEVQNQPKADAVTYSTVKASSAAGASSDPDSLYAVIGEPK